jgi:hypothetical protein
MAPTPEESDGPFFEQHSTTSKYIRASAAHTFSDFENCDKFQY